jgi:hypothetical protein
MEHGGIDGHTIQMQSGLLTAVRGLGTKHTTLSRISCKESGQHHAQTSAPAARESKARSLLPLARMWGHCSPPRLVQPS